jgi:hypothetical protein
MWVELHVIRFMNKLLFSMKNHLMFHSLFDDALLTYSETCSKNMVL